MRRLGLLELADKMNRKIENDELSVEPNTSIEDGEIEGEKEAKEGDDEYKPRAKRADDDEHEEKKLKDVRGMGNYLVLGRRYRSLRQAEKVTGIPKSTIAYRIHSDDPKFADYKEISAQSKKGKH